MKPIIFYITKTAYEQQHPLIQEALKHASLSNNMYYVNFDASWCVKKFFSFKTNHLPIHMISIATLFPLNRFHWIYTMNMVLSFYLFALYHRVIMVFLRSHTSLFWINHTSCYEIIRFVRNYPIFIDTLDYQSIPIDGYGEFLSRYASSAILFSILTSSKQKRTVIVSWGNSLKHRLHNSLQAIAKSL
jgi:hypothetical protein